LRHCGHGLDLHRLASRKRPRPAPTPPARVGGRASHAAPSRRPGTAGRGGQPGAGNL